MGAQSAIVTVNVNIVFVNSPPVGIIAPVNMNENGVASVALSTNDPDGNTVSVTIIQLPAAGTLSQYNGPAITSVNTAVTYTNASLDQVSTLWWFTFTPFTNQFGSAYASIIFKLDDGKGQSNSITTVTATINVAHVNQPPVAYDVSVTMTEDDAPLIFVLNATDVDLTPVSAYILTLPTSVGTLQTTSGSALAQKSFVADPRSVQFVLGNLAYGTASFTFQAFDGQLYSANTATVTINVAHKNHAPTASAVSPITTVRSSTVPISFSAADVDLADIVTVKITAFNSGDGGTFSVGGTALTQETLPFTVGSFQSSAISNFNSYSVSFDVPDVVNTTNFANFTFVAYDDTTDSGPILITINVENNGNHPPVANSVIVSVTQGIHLHKIVLVGQYSETETVAFPNNYKLILTFLCTDQSTGAFYLNGTDEDTGDEEHLKFFIQNLPRLGQLTANGNLVTVANLPLQLTKTDALNYTTTSRGIDNFLFYVVDLLDAVSLTATVTINIIPVDHAPTASFPAQVSTPENEQLDITQISTADIDAGDDVIVKIAALPDKGYLTQANGDKIDIAPTVITDPNYKLIYIPPHNVYGSTSFIFYADDQQGKYSANITANIEVTHVNQPPEAVSDSSSVTENSNGNDFYISVTDIDTPNENLAAIITSLPDSSYGVLTLPNGSIVSVNDIIAYPFELSFTPVAYQYGNVSFTFYGFDGFLSSSIATYVIDITFSNTAPSAQAASPVYATRTVPVSITLGATDPDSPETLQFRITSYSHTGIRLGLKRDLLI